MELELHSTSRGPIVNGYGENYITISGKRVKNTFLLFPDKLHEIKNKSDDAIINIVKEYKNTFSEMSPKLKMSIDHRYKAFLKLKNFF